MRKHPESGIESALHRLLEGYEEHTGTNFIDERILPQSIAVDTILHNLLEIIFPGYSGRQEITSDNITYIIGGLLSQVRCDLREQVLYAYKHECKIAACREETCEIMADKAVTALIEALPEIRRILKIDVRAAFDGDPAASSPEEVVICYPGLKAIAVHRIAHVLYMLKVPLIPRMMSEISHNQTGIDIHPGARIGAGLMIDHGTGVVIGETTVIGTNVKIYQGVTLGALSFPKNACGELIRDQKRHPTIGDHVTIYAHATILGNVTVGGNSIIGSNVWLKDDVPDQTMVLSEPPSMTFRSFQKTSRKNNESDRAAAGEVSKESAE